MLGKVPHLLACAQQLGFLALQIIRAPFHGQLQLMLLHNQQMHPPAPERNNAHAAQQHQRYPQQIALPPARRNRKVNFLRRRLGAATHIHGLGLELVISFGRIHPILFQPKQPVPNLNVVRVAKLQRRHLHRKRACAPAHARSVADRCPTESYLRNRRRLRRNHRSCLRLHQVRQPA